MGGVQYAYAQRALPIHSPTPGLQSASAAFLALLTVIKGQPYRVPVRPPTL